MGVYCSAEDVALICNLTDHQGNRAVFGTSPATPSRDEVETLIGLAEDYITDRCNNAWGTNYIQVLNEMYDFYCDYLECSLQINHPNIMTFDDSEGDKLECWMGSAWKDWILDYTEGRGNDFWVDYKIGKIWFLSAKPARGRQRIRLSYRYNGGAAIPSPVREATALLVGITLANSEYVDILFPEGSSPDLSKEDLISRWERKVSENLKRFTVSTVPVGLDFVPIEY